MQIRDVQDSDLAVFFEQQRDPEANRMAAFPAREREAFMAHWAKIRANRTGITQAIVAGGQVVGNLVCWEQDGHHEVGYWVGRDYWGRGIASEALAQLIGQVKVRPLYAYVAEHNVGSIRVLEKCGFQRAAEEDIPPDASDESSARHVALVLEA